MADMREAGLNPILAYKQGGAGTPGGSTYSPVNVGQAGVLGAQSGASSAMAAKQLSLNKAKTTGEIQNLYEDTRNKQVERSILNENYRARSISNEILLEDLKVAGAAGSSAVAAKEFFDSPMGKLLRKFELGSRSVIPFYGNQRPWSPGRGPKR